LKIFSPQQNNEKGIIVMVQKENIIRQPAAKLRIGEGSTTIEKVVNLHNLVE